MTELRLLATSELIDELAKYTSEYTKLSGEGVTHEEYQRCKMTIKALQAEIGSRRSNDIPNTTPPDYS